MNNADDLRLRHLRDFYAVLAELSAVVGGPTKLASCNGRSPWPRRGIYFFFEPAEVRTDSGDGPRVVRVGTHALTSTSSSTLWGRLSQHRGQAARGGGNHRGSIFRLIVGASLIQSKGYDFPTWGQGSCAPPDVRAGELSLELEVSKVIGAMPFLWLSVDDEPGPESARGFIERNAIALLSNHSKPPLDPASSAWLGHACNREKVRRSGLWNSNHVEDNCDPRFLDVMAGLVAKAGRRI